MTYIDRDRRFLIQFLECYFPRIESRSRASITDRGNALTPLSLMLQINYEFLTRFPLQKKSPLCGARVQKQSTKALTTLIREIPGSIVLGIKIEDWGSKAGSGVKWFVPSCEPIVRWREFKLIPRVFSRSDR